MTHPDETADLTSGPSSRQPVLHGRDQRSVDGSVHGAEDEPVLDGDVPPTPAQRRSTGPGPLVRHCGPLPLLVVSLLAVPASLTVHSWGAGLAGVLAVLGCLPFVVGAWRGLPRRLLTPLIAALSVGWSTWLVGDQDEPLLAAVTAVLRLLVLVLPGALLLAWLDPDETGDHLAQRVRLPGRVVVAVVVALGQLSTLVDTWDQVSAARRVRGLGAGRGPVSRVRWAASTAFGLLVDAVRRAARTAVAMDARGFSGNAADDFSGSDDGPGKTAGFDVAHRTWALPAPWRRCDTVLVVVGVVVLAIPGVAGIAGA